MESALTDTRGSRNASASCDATPAGSSVAQLALPPITATSVATADRFDLLRPNLAFMGYSALGARPKRPCCVHSEQASRLHAATLGTAGYGVAISWRSGGQAIRSACAAVNSSCCNPMAVHSRSSPNDREWPGDDRAVIENRVATSPTNRRLESRTISHS